MFSKLTPIVKLLIITNVIVFSFEFLFKGFVIADIPFKIWWMKNFALMPLNGLNVGNGIVFNFEIWQLITYQFLHGDFWHLFFNMFMLWMFGRELEEFWGSAKFVSFYLLCGVGAGLLHMLVSISLGQIAPAVGASGSLYGLFFGFIMFNPDRRLIIFPIFIPLKAKWIGIGLVIISVIGGLNSSDGIAHFAHLGGGIMGVLLVKFGETIPIFNVARRLIKFGIPSNEYPQNNKWAPQKRLFNTNLWWSKPPWNNCT